MTPSPAMAAPKVLCSDIGPHYEFYQLTAYQAWAKECSYTGSKKARLAADCGWSPFATTSSWVQGPFEDKDFETGSCLLGIESDAVDGFAIYFQLSDRRFIDVRHFSHLDHETRQGPPCFCYVRFVRTKHEQGAPWRSATTSMRERRA